MTKVAFLDNSFIGVEVREALAELGVETLPFESSADFFRLLGDHPDTDFALSVNFSETLQRDCREAGMTYAAWAFDSGVLGTGQTVMRGGLGDADFLFLFNSRDARDCAAVHPNTFHLPVAASGMFERPPMESGHERDVLAVMNIFTDFGGNLHDAFLSVSGREEGEGVRKAMDLMRSIIELCLEKHAAVFDRYLLDRMVMDCLRQLDVNIFNERMVRELCLHYGYALSFRQRAMLLEKLRDAGVRADVYGKCDGLETALGGSSVSLRGVADYKTLPALYNASKININLNQVSNLDSVPQRIFHLLASGSFALSSHSDELAGSFTPGKHLDTFRDFDEMIDKISYYLSHEDERLRIARAGHEEFMRNHRMAARLAFIIGKCARPAAMDEDVFS